MRFKEKGWSFKPIDVICFTHYHGDHISGLPGLLLTMGNAERTEPLTLIGPKGLERVVNALRVIAPELPFPIIYKEINGNEETFELTDGYRRKRSGEPWNPVLRIYPGTGSGRQISASESHGAGDSKAVLEPSAEG